MAADAASAPVLDVEPDIERRPIEIFSQDQLQAHAAAIAATHRLSSNPRRARPLLPRLDVSGARLDEAYFFLSAAARRDPQPVGSEEWLRDNHHVVQDQIRQIRQDLPRKYYLELPKLAGPPFQGYPRVYLLARELVAHTAGRFNLDTLVDFAGAYQRTAQLTIGEIWAIPIMLRLALVEELHRLADGVVEARRSRDKARRWHEALTDGGALTSLVIERLLEDATQENGRLSPTFVVELLQWLRDQPSSAAPIWQALHRALQAQDDSPEEMLRVEHQREAADQLGIGNVITSMRRLSSIDWTLFFESVSLVERILREDPAGAYAAMDFPTRDRYRHSIEQLAKRARTLETAVAIRAVDLARSAIENQPQQDRRHHVGYYLISRGRFVLEQDLHYTPMIRERVARFVFRHPALGYLSTIAGTVALGVASLLAYAARHGASGPELWLVGILSLLPVTELAISLINLIVTSQVPPRNVPKLEMRGGIPARDRTIVAVPVIVESEARLATLFDDLEVRFLANRDDHLHFALLSDFADANAEVMPTDDAIVAAARRRVDELNDRYGADRFFFFHRARLWNGGESRWMGWERKRGKLTEFNRLLRGATDTTFTVILGDRSILPSIKFVITLDSDTQLPMETGRRLVGALAHPLNRPRFDRERQRVTEGYGVLQPRVGVNLVSANRTTFAKVFSGHVGIDPYTTAVSDIYQDLFHEGSYVGKGIYDVDAFDAALAGRVPEQTLLSHDLFEGFYARAGLCTDIHLVDDYPTHYLAFAARQHRWARGDWQIVRWLWRTVPNAERRPVPNALPVVARWKILDNLRRSLLSPALLLLLGAGWTVLPGSAVAWTVLAIMVLAFPAYAQVGRSLSSRIRGVPFREHVAAERDSLVTSARQAFLSTAFLAHQAWLMTDAVARTVWRLVVTRRHLLQWVRAERLARLDPTPIRVFRQMWTAPAIAVALLVLVSIVSPARLLLALPILALWFASPALAYATGRPISAGPEPLDADGRSALRTVARRTWGFFEDFVGPGDNWLVPDNYQEDRKEPVAHRTSPTNIGLQFLSTLAAYDFGYVSLSGALARLEPAFATLLRLHRYRGHFYNWYDTRSLAPLAPAYISTVDSGNLAGYLLTVKTALVELSDEAPIIDARALTGIGDAVELCTELVEDASFGRGKTPGRALRRELSELRRQLTEPPETLTAWRDLLAQLADRLSAANVLLHEIEDAGGEADVPGPAAEIGVWLERAAAAIAERQADLDRLAPWSAIVDRPDSPVPGPEGVPGLAALVAWCRRTLTALEGQRDASELRALVDRSRANAEDLIERASRLAGLSDDLVEETEFGFLFNPERKLFSIGLSVTDGRLDDSYYDTLASEARLASFVAIAMAKIPHEHWFKLGRSLTPSGTSRALLSWSASMFEYLMPLLVMRAYPGTLLDETYRAVVQRQMQYGARRGVPWGISESAYNAIDLERNYQYRAFGVPGLGLKRGLADELVIAPYATMLAAPLRPGEVVENLQRLAAQGLAGRYGFYEAIDYTAERIPPGDKRGGVVLPTYMAHHQGMSLVAIDNALNGAPMQHRFHADPRVQAADLLLQERIPRLVPLKNPPIEIAEHVPSSRLVTAPAVRRYTTPQTLSPRAHLLSNGSYSVMVTNAGGGYSRRQQLALTRWREDITTDAWGTFCYVRDLDAGEVWSVTYQPTAREPEDYEVIFAPDRAVCRRIDGGLEIRTEVVVSAEDDAELRRISVTNHTARSRSIELTSYAEVVLAPPDADLAHPVFSNLFVETQFVPERDAIICTRRPRAGTDRQYLVHVLGGRGRVGVATQYETDRARFIGRGGTLARPAALFDHQRLSNTTGAVLDPIVSLRQSLRLPPGGTARLSFTTGYADTEQGARLLIEKYHDRRAVARALALASTHSQVELRHLTLTVEDALLFQRLGGRLLYADPRLRADEAVEQNVRGQRDLWKLGISGDLPILLVRVADIAAIALVIELLKAHEYLRLKGLAFDLVIVNEHPPSYLQELQQELQRLVEGGPEQAWVDRPGGVFLRRADLIPEEDRLLLRAAARATLDAEDGGLRHQLTHAKAPTVPEPPEPEDVDTPSTASSAPAFSASPPPDAEIFNGLGGFQADGHEYVVHVHHDDAGLPPSPWTNVVASPVFGFAATETGPGYTWSENSHDNRLTPWRNDPVSDPPGEAVFIRDDETRAVWSATPLPAGGGYPYTVRHGQGYTAYEHARHDLQSTLLLFVPREQPVKIFRLALRNTSSARRRVSVTLYVEWVLGESRSRSAMHIVTGRDPGTGALTARNVFRQEFSNRIAFLDLSPSYQRRVTADRTEFIGRNGTLERPAGLARAALSNRTGAALDPCGAVQVVCELAPGEEHVLIGLLGDARHPAEVRTLVERYRNRATVDAALAEVRGFWGDLLGTLIVRTPDRALDLMLNRWSLYQTLSCRIWGRSGFYQSSGAYGFRDQLQDTLALLFAAPDLTRAHLLKAASRQFVEGDVQHWWHEPGGHGTRTRFSDDRLWLPYATLQYLAATGDAGVLDERVPFLQGRPLNPDEHEWYGQAAVSTETGSLYEHCVRAIDISLGTGPHGLPLMGGGDWNDGMNLVGIGGRGESVWLGWFLVSILRPFADLAARREDAARAAEYRNRADALIPAIEDAWDGAWYRRAYFDDGTPLGSALNTECQIDSIAQSWAVISAAGDPARARQAMEAVDARLVRRQDRLILLLTPPFDHMVPSPGYIQGYLPGVRENGGQYTHAALWTVLAFAKLGDGDRAAELFALLNPVNHGRSPDEIERYRVEPYAVPADVYSVAPHTGRGGWTWYTGSAGWMYRVGIEGLLGVTLRDGRLHVDPCIPRRWPRYEVTFKRATTTYRLVVENPAGVNRGVVRLEVDGVDRTGQDVPLVDDGAEHTVRVELG